MSVHTKKFCIQIDQGTEVANQCPQLGNHSTWEVTENDLSIELCVDLWAVYLEKMVLK